jgi:Ribbon-helix-helix protein, copG family
LPSQHKRAPLSIRLPEAEEARLRAYADERGISVNEAIRLAVRELLGDEVPE